MQYLTREYVPFNMTPIIDYFREGAGFFPVDRADPGCGERALIAISSGQVPNVAAMSGFYFNLHRRNSLLPQTWILEPAFDPNAFLQNEKEP